MILIVMLLTSARSAAGVRMLDQSVEVNQSARTATFSLLFDHAPDFHSVDAHNRPTDSFQVEVDGSWTLGQQPLSAITAVVRGDEIRFANDMLPIRMASPPDDNPHSGGWGGIITSVPFTANGNQISFTAPLADLPSPSGVFSYLAFTMHDGQTTASAEAQSVPLPEAFTAGMCLLVAMAAHRWRRVFACAA